MGLSPPKPGLRKLLEAPRRSTTRSSSFRARNRISNIEKGSAQLTVQALTAGKTATFQTDVVVHSAGRVPEINDLNLDAAGIEWEKRGVRVNEFLQSVSIPSVYAAGDAAASGGPPLAPVASYEGMIVAANLLQGNHLRPSYLGVP